MKADSGDKKGFLKRISLKTKIIAVLILLVIASFALVAAFAAGFATGTMLAEMGQKDYCSAIDGTWNAENRICIDPAAFREELPYSSTADEFSCGDGSRFTLEVVSSSTERFTLAGKAPRDLAVVTEGIMTRYEDSEVTVVPDGIDALYTDRVSGRSVTCTMTDPQGSQE